MAELMNEFDAPIPMASMTEELGSRAYEKPPQYTDPADAFDVIIDGLTTEKAMERISIAVQLGVPAELVTQSLMFSGWATGKYSFDTMLYLAGPVFEVLTNLLDQADVNYQKFAEREGDTDIEEAMKLLKKLQSGEIEETSEEEPEEPVEEVEDEMEKPEMMPEESTESEIPRGGLMGGIE